MRATSMAAFTSNERTLAEIQRALSDFDGRSSAVVEAATQCAGCALQVQRVNELQESVASLASDISSLPVLC